MALMGGATSESQRFRQMLDGIFGRAQVPGAAVGVFEGDSSHLYTLGSLAVDDPRPVDADTPFQLGSTTKAFTALALMRLSSEGKLDLDTPVQHYLPTFRVRDATASRMVTTRHLLTHAAGFEGDFCRDTGHGDEALSIALEAMRDLEQLHPPGTMWSYCNAGYSVAARLVEVVADESYEEAIRRLLLAPLDVEGIGFGTAAFGDTPLAEGHELGARGSSRLDTWQLPRALHGVAGVASSVTDLLRFAAFHLGPGQPLLRPEAMTALLDPSRLRAGAPRQAMAWRAAPLQGTTVLEVGGSTTAQCGLMVLVPDHRFAMVAMANSGTGAALLQRIKTAALKEFCALTTGKQRTPAATNRAEACTGHYRNPTHDLELHFDGSQLTVQVTFKRGGFPFDTFDEVRQVPALPCTLYDDDRLAVLPDTPFERTGGVVRNEHGGIDWVLLHGRAHRRTEY